MNQTDVHAAEKTDRARVRSLGSEDADKIRTFLFLEDKRSDVRQLADAIDDRELDMRIIFRHLLHDRSLRKADSDDEVEISFRDRKSTRLNSSHIPLSRMPSSA